MELEYFQPGERVNWAELPGQYAHGMKNSPTYRWWKPLLAGIVAGGFYLIFVVILAAVMVVASGASLDSPDFAETADALSDPTNPLLFGLSLISALVMMPAVGIASKIFGLGGLRRMSSVDGRLRWDRIKAFAPWTLLVIVAFTLVQLVAEFATGETTLADVRFLPVTMVVIIILAPAQSAAEEYALRGFTMQAFASWIPLVIIPVILQAAIFGSLHSQYNILGMVSCAFMGLCCGYIACKTGGIEGGIAIHASNNVVSMLLACFFASAESTYDITVVAFAADMFLQVMFLLVVLWTAKRKGYILKKATAPIEDLSEPVVHE